MCIRKNTRTDQCWLMIKLVSCIYIIAIMSTPRNQNGARRGRKSNNEARTTIDGETTREGQVIMLYNFFCSNELYK